MCGDDAQPGARVEEEQEVDDVSRHGEGSRMRWRAPCGAVSKALRASKEKTSLGLPRWSCRCAMNSGGPVLEPGRAPCCQSLTTPCRVSTYVMRWVRGPVQQLHVQLAQGYGPVGVQSGRARYLGAEPDVRVSPVHRRRGTAEDGPVGVDQEPLDGCREGLDETGLHVVGTWGPAIGLVHGGLQVLHGVLLDLCPGPFKDPGDMAAEDCLEAWEVHRAFVIQFPPEGANWEHHDVGHCEERLGVGDPHVPEA